jgi:hypothetical protein
MYPWNHWRTYAPMIAGVSGMVLFMLWSSFVPEEPILRGSMFKSPTALASYFGTTCHGLFLWSCLYYMPLYFEAAKGMSPVKAGIALFPWTFTTGPAAIVVGLLIAKTGKYRWAIWLGWTLAAGGIGLLTTFEADTPASLWIPISMVSGLGMGILYSAMSFAIQAAASNRDLPFAAALYSFFRSFGQMLGVAVGGVIFQNQVKYNLEKYPAVASNADSYSKDASALVEVIKSMPLSQAGEKAVIISSYVDSLKVLWAAMCGFACLALIIAVLFTKSFSLTRELETEQGFQRSVKRTGDAERDASSLRSMGRPDTSYTTDTTYSKELYHAM